MRQKLHRGKRPVFRKRNPALRIIGTVVVVFVIVAGGFFGAKFITEHPQTAPIPGTQVEQSTAPTTTAKPTTKPKEETATLTTVRAFYLPFSALQKEDLSDTLAKAKKAGFNSVVFELKDAEGNLYYRSSTDYAAKVDGYAEKALTKKQLKSLFALIRKAGLAPIPRLYAFKDNVGSRALVDARIAYKGNPSWAWYDGIKDNGAKTWLNPYDNDAHDYISGLAVELKKLGAGAILLDGVQFPNPAVTGQADFGKDNAKLKWDEVLTLFVSKTKKKLGKECPLILACTAESALGTATQVYGGNPLTFAPTMASPTLTAEAVQESVKTMILRTKVMEEADKPALSPALDIQGLSAKQVKAMMADCAAGGADSFILYHPNGDYNFGAY